MLTPTPPNTCMHDSKQKPHGQHFSFFIYPQTQNIKQDRQACKSFILSCVQLEPVTCHFQI